MADREKGLRVQRWEELSAVHLVPSFSSSCYSSSFFSCLLALASSVGYSDIAHHAPVDPGASGQLQLRHHRRPHLRRLRLRLREYPEEVHMLPLAWED